MKKTRIVILAVLIVFGTALSPLFGNLRRQANRMRTP